MSGSAGFWSKPLRVLLGVLERGYEAAIKSRERRFRSPASSFRVAVPVISVGNITVGGTGKTPLVMDVVQRLQRMGRRPAVVARGYGAKQGAPNDEEVLIRKHCPLVFYVSDPDRVRGARRALQQADADVIVLDDGFQHLGIVRDLDIVTVDATCPFGHDHLLPRGLLREPLSALARAQLIVITRCDQVPPSAIVPIEARLSQLAPRAMRLQCRHRVNSVQRMDGRIVHGAVEGSLHGKRAVVFAAIGRPRAFLQTVQSLGVHVVATRWWRDHHRYGLGDIHNIVVPGRVPQFDVLLTTEKDAVKLAALSGYDPAAIMVVHVAIDFIGDGSKIFDESLRCALARSSMT